jgi:hypothetical protein
MVQALWQMGKVILIDEPSVIGRQINTVAVNEEKVDRVTSCITLSSERKLSFFAWHREALTPILNKSQFERLLLDIPTLRITRYS